ncbi:MAG: DHH family phosphoesterase [Candidatus Woesearchaeota archaeon]
MLTQEEVNILREEVLTARNPLFIYDDDPDGLCSFLILYRMIREGHGTMVKTSPKVDVSFLRRVEEYQPDKIFVLDMPFIDQEFLDGVKVPVFWIDHHDPQQMHKVKYFNPKTREPNSYYPVTWLAYQISGNPEDLWLATTGVLFDAAMPNFIGAAQEKYPELIPSTPKTVAEAVYKMPIGKLVRIFSFLLKGATSEVNRCIKILSRIKSPEEILEQTTSQGKFLYTHYDKMVHAYDNMLERAKEKVTRSKLLLFYYTEQKWSFTSDLANELFSLYPQKVILIARNKSGEMKCSLRSDAPITKALENALIGVEGYGGGHPKACGVVVKEKDWEQFLKNLKREIKKI